MMARVAKGVAVTLAFCVLFATSACLIQPFPADCPTDAVNDCARCQQHSGCGWCEGLGCMPGTSIAPDDRDACAPSQWFFNDCDSPAPYCNNTCSTAHDGVCDEPRDCDPGTDCTDCREE